MGIFDNLIQDIEKDDNIGPIHSVEVSDSPPGDNFCLIVLSLINSLLESGKYEIDDSLKSTVDVADFIMRDSLDPVTETPCDVLFFFSDKTDTDYNELQNFKITDDEISFMRKCVAAFMAFNSDETDVRADVVVIGKPVQGRRAPIQQYSGVVRAMLVSSEGDN